MAKNGKTYSITEAQLEDMIKKASEAGAEAYKKEQSHSARRKVDRMWIRSQRNGRTSTTRTPRT